MSDDKSATDGQLTLDYHGMVRERRRLSPLTARRVAYISFVPATIGLLMLAAYRITANDSIVYAGMIGAFVLGFTTLFIGIVAVINIFTATLSRPPQIAARKFYLLALAGALVSVVAAFVCVIYGSQWFLAPHAPLSVRNDSGVPLDGVVIHAGSGDIEASSLAPGETRYLGKPWLRQSGSLEVTTIVNGQSRRFVDRASVDWMHEKKPEKRQQTTIVIEPTELPKAGK